MASGDPTPGSKLIVKNVSETVRKHELREKFEKKGMTFYIHIDGAWGCYFASCLRRDPEAINFPQEIKSAASVMAEDSGACIFNEAQLSQHFQTTFSKK